jgi:ABC-type polysaccharide/polyol phosphate transport system ATPase subunit
VVDPSIVFHRVWKKFHLGERHDSLRDLLPALAQRLVRRDVSKTELERQEFWAVRDLSFEVRPGQALGIIGPNGAGKSTVLKLLTRILRPTRGLSEVRGRVGALIEIGAGFHPDLTGRENVYLQGAIMGMKRAEVARKFEEIVEFAGVEEFIDTQVKRYSSGMNARLGFAIAAHMDPDILIVDEVLSVGDYAFQNKAFDSIRRIVDRGTPVVVVSHQLERIASLCNQAVLLERGRVVRHGSPSECIAEYVLGHRSTELPPELDSPIQINSVRLDSAGPIPTGSYFRTHISGSVREHARPDSLTIAVFVRSLNTGHIVFVTGTSVSGIRLPTEGAIDLVLDLQANVPEGLYSIEPHVWDLRLKREIAWGPSVTIQVEPNEIFSGSVNMNPRISVAPYSRRTLVSNVDTGSRS